MMDKIEIEYSADDEVTKAILNNKDFIMKETLANSIEESKDLEIFDLNTHKTGIKVIKA